MHFISLANSIGMQAGLKAKLPPQEQSETGGFDALLGTIDLPGSGEAREAPLPAEGLHVPLALALLPAPPAALAESGKSLPAAGSPAPILPRTELAMLAAHQPVQAPTQHGAATALVGAANAANTQAEAPQAGAAASLATIMLSPLPGRAAPDGQIPTLPVPGAESAKPAAAGNPGLPTPPSAGLPIVSGTSSQPSAEMVRQSAQPVASGGGEPALQPQEIMPAKQPPAPERKVGLSIEAEPAPAVETAQRATGAATIGLLASGSEQPVRGAANAGPVAAQPSILEADLEQVVDRLSAARLTARAEKASMALPHPDFGRVTLDFTTGQGDRLSVATPDAPAELRQALVQGLGAQQGRAETSSARTDAALRDFPQGSAGEDTGQRRESGQAQSDRRPDRQDARNGASDGRGQDSSTAHSANRSANGAANRSADQPAGRDRGTWA